MFTVDQFVSYLDGIRKRTLMYVDAIPESLFHWRPAEDKFTIAELVRHLGSTEVMFYRVCKSGEWIYPGHGDDKGKTLAEACEYLNRCHQTVLDGLRQFDERDLKKKVPTMAGHEVSAWRILFALTEHEIHHRGQLTAYLQGNGIHPPQIFGLRIEQVPNE